VKRRLWWDEWLAVIALVLPPSQFAASLQPRVEAHPSPDFFRRGSEGRVINSIFWGWTLQELSFIMGLFAQDKFLNMSQNACRLSDARCMNHNVNSEFKKISLPKLSA